MAYDGTCRDILTINKGYLLAVMIYFAAFSLLDRRQRFMGKLFFNLHYNKRYCVKKRLGYCLICSCIDVLMIKNVNVQGCLKDRPNGDV